MALPTPFAQKVLELVRGITDPGIRIEIMRTLYFLAQVYLGGASEEEVYSDLVDVLAKVIRFREPGLPQEEVVRRAEQLAGELMEVLRIEAMSRRLMMKARGRGGARF